MQVNEALKIIKNERLRVAKKEIIAKFNAPDENINGFLYTKENTFYRHPLSAIKDEDILNGIYMAMVSLSVSYTPLKLLVLSGENADRLRKANEFYDIRKPKFPTIGAELDIDEALCVAVIYDTLESLDLNEFRGKSKDLLNDYERNFIMPNPKNIADINFRFSKDKANWHSAYEQNDAYFSIFKNEIWGEAIPLIGTNIQAPSSFLGLEDTPASYEAGKFLACEDSKIVFKDIKIPQISPTPKSLEFKELRADESGLDLTTAPQNFILDLDKDLEFKIKKSADLADLMADNVEFNIFVKTNSFNFSFNNKLTILDSGASLNLRDVTHINFKIIRFKSGVIAVYGISYGSY